MKLLLGRAVYLRHRVVLTAIGVYAVNTKDEEVMEAKRRVREIVLARPAVRQMHGFYLSREEKEMRFDIVVSLDAEDRRAVYREVVRDARKAYPDCRPRVAMDTDFAEE